MKKLVILVLSVAGCVGGIDDGAVDEQGAAVKVGDPDAVLSTLTVDRTTARADGVDSVTITVTALDAGGHPLKNCSATLSATGGGNQLTQPASGTDNNGVMTGALRSTVTGAKTISASLTCKK